MSKVPTPARRKLRVRDVIPTPETDEPKRSSGDWSIGQRVLTKDIDNLPPGAQIQIDRTEPYEGTIYEKREDYFWFCPNGTVDNNGDPMLFDDVVMKRAVNATTYRVLKLPPRSQSKTNSRKPSIQPGDLVTVSFNGIAESIDWDLDSSSGISIVVNALIDGQTAQIRLPESYVTKQ